MCWGYEMNHKLHNSGTHRERQQQLEELQKNLDKVHEEADVLRSQLRTVQKSTQVSQNRWCPCATFFIFIIHLTSPQRRHCNSKQNLKQLYPIFAVCLWDSIHHDP